MQEAAIDPESLGPEGLLQRVTHAGYEQRLVAIYGSRASVAAQLGTVDQCRGAIGLWV